MSETDNNSQGEKPRTCLLAKASLVWAAVGILLAAVLIPPVGSLPFTLFPAIGVALGIIALIRIKTSKGRIRGTGSAGLAIIINSALVFVNLGSLYKETTMRQGAYRTICGSTLHGLGKAMLVYESDGSNYPTADKWCDLLIRADYVTEKQFKCPEDKQGPCSYAMNKHVVELGMGMATPTDLVLLFESKPGWNQVGGPEILTTENHNGTGCNIMFCDFHVEFVPTERLEELKWKLEEANSVD